MSMNILKKVLVALGVGEAETEKVALVATDTTKDGINIGADAFEVGNPLFVLAEDGTPAPAAEGVYETGTHKIAVDANGIISAVDLIEEEQEAEADTSTEMEKKVISALEALVAELTHVKTEMAKIQSNLKIAEAKLEKFSKTPGAEKIKTSFIEMKKEEASNLENRLEILRKIRFENKK